MNIDQVRRVRELVQDYADKSGEQFDKALERVIGTAQYHAFDVVPWGKQARACGSGKIKES